MEIRVRVTLERLSPGEVVLKLSTSLPRSEEKLWQKEEIVRYGVPESSSGHLYFCEQGAYLNL